MGETQRCPQCDAEFNPAASPLGVCPACLLRLGASDPAMKPLAIEQEPDVSTAVVASPAGSNRTIWRRMMPIAGVAAMVVAALSVFFLARTSNVRSTPLSAVVRFVLSPPEETTSVEGRQFAVSPDGSRIVLAASGSDGQTRLWVRALQSMEWRALARTEGAELPFWSPDSRQIGFFAERKLKKVDVSNGLTQTLTEASLGRGGSWGRDTIVFAPTAAGPIFRIPASGGTPQPATTLDESAGETAHTWPHFLPDGRSVVFDVTAAGDRRADSEAGSRGSGQVALHLVSLDSGQRKLVITDGRSAAFAQGVLLFVRGTQLLAQRFDPQRGEFEDDHRPISGAEEVGDSTRGAGFSVSDGSVLVHRVGASTESQLLWFDRAGQTLGVTADPAEYQQFSISPEGRRVAVARRDPRDATSSIWLIELDRQMASRMTTVPSHNSSPLWLPDGRRVAFVSRRGGKVDLYATNADGGGHEELLDESWESKDIVDASPDGRFLIYSTTSVRTGSDLWLLPLGGDRKPQPLLQTAFNESDGRLSPDGRWMAYVSDESGRDEVYVQPFPQADGRWQISPAGGRRPRWRRDGRELFFASPDGNLLAVDAEARQRFQSGTPRMLFPMPQGQDYEVSPDGQRFLVKARTTHRERDALRVILNWSEELRRDPMSR